MTNPYEIMHLNRIVARIDRQGRCRIFYPSFMPYNLYLEESNDFDALLNNMSNFYYWCSSRMLSLDRVHAKAILNSLGMRQAVTDRDRAEIALTYRCLTITDVFWVREFGEKITYEQVNLYDNHLSNALMDISLRGKQYTVNNKSIIRDVSTMGVYPKAWQRRDDGFYLFKDGTSNAVDREVIASSICQCFDVDQVVYTRGEFDGCPVSVSKNITSREYSIASIESFDIYCVNKERDTRRYIIRLDKKNYHMMNIIDYLVGNTDRHWGNWGVLVDNKNNKPRRLHALMDFNQAFNAYDTIEGANCQTGFGKRLSQCEAAVDGVKAVGLNQVKLIPGNVFSEIPEYAHMFEQRLALLKEIDSHIK